MCLRHDYPSLRGPHRWKILFFIICFYAIMHRTIVQNKIITIISCLFFVQLVFIGLVQGRCGQVSLIQNNFNHSIFITEGNKKKITQNCMHYNTLPQILNFHFHLFLKLFQKCLHICIKKMTGVCYEINQNYYNHFVKKQERGPLGAPF